MWQIDSREELAWALMWAVELEMLSERGRGELDCRLYGWRWGELT